MWVNARSFAKLRGSAEFARHNYERGGSREVNEQCIYRMSR
jgi:hypothetical protein